MMQAVAAIFFREIKRALADRWAWFISFGFPVFLIYALGKGVDTFADTSTLGVAYSSFLAPAVLAIWVQLTSSGIGQSYIEDRQGVVRQLRVAPIQRVAILLGKVLAELALAFIVFIVLLVFVLQFVGNLSLLAFLLSLFLLLLTAFGFYGFYLVLSFLFSRAKSFSIIAGLVTSGIVFLSNAFFPVQNLPVGLRILVHLNPLTYAIDGLRVVMLGAGSFSFAFDAAVLLSFAALAMAGGTIAFSRATSS